MTQLHLDYAPHFASLLIAAAVFWPPVPFQACLGHPSRLPWSHARGNLCRVAHLVQE